MQLRFDSTANAFSKLIERLFEVRGQLRQSFLNSAPILFLPFSTLEKFVGQIERREDRHTAGLVGAGKPGGLLHPLIHRAGKLL